MNFLYTLLYIILFFTVNPIAARSRTVAGPAAPAITPPAQPKPTPAKVQLPAQMPQPTPAQIPTYINLRNEIANKNPNTIFNSQTKLFELKFMQDMSNAAKSAGIGKIGLEFLLQFARDKHYRFTGNNSTDRQLVEKINNQIDNAIKQL